MSAASSQLTWINLQESSIGIDAELRKRVRSHVTALQHRKRRVTRKGKVLQRAESSSEDGEGSESLEFHSIAASTRHVLVAEIDADPHTALLKREDTDSASSEDADHEYVSTTAVVSASMPCDGYSPQRLLQDPTDELDRHTRRLDANVPDVLRFYGHLIDRQAPKFRQMSSLPRHNSRKPILIRYVTTDPALLAAASLLVLSHVRSFQPQHTLEATEASIVQLRQYAINTMQKAIDTCVVSDQLVLAVGMFMCYETIFGRPERYHVHAKGLRDMVILRGGMQNFGLGGLIEALIRWYDANTASLNKCAPYLEDLPRTKKDGLRADREHFLLWTPEGKPQQERVHHVE